MNSTLISPPSPVGRPSQPAVIQPSSPLISTRVVSIRWSQADNAWAIVDELKPEVIVERITAYPAYLLDVTFAAHSIVNTDGSRMVMCGPPVSNVSIVGIARGNLVFDRPVVTRDAVPCNLAFKDGQFRSCATVVTSARAIRLSDNRFATIWL